jgi:hypothetical protein
MNVLLLSPHFPQNFQRFTFALREAGATVLGAGDAPPDELGGNLHGVLAEYCHVPNMADYESLYRGAAGFISRHGRLDRVDSHAEHWLSLEAALRQDFGISGPSCRGTASLPEWHKEVCCHSGRAAAA